MFPHDQVVSNTRPDQPSRAAIRWYLICVFLVEPGAVAAVVIHDPRLVVRVES